MDCDDQIRLVKRNDPHPLPPNVFDIPPVAVRVQIDMLGIRNQSFGVGNRRADVTSPIFRMSREAHIRLRANGCEFSPQKGETRWVPKWG
jgi:hypothetical protein